LGGGGEGGGIIMMQVGVAERDFEAKLKTSLAKCGGSTGDKV